VNCDKIARVIPEFRPQWTVARGVEQLYDAYRKFGLTADAFGGTKFLRMKRIKQLQGSGRLDNQLRWRADAPAASSVELAQSSVK
jgi:hypothetical protein